MKDDDGDEKKKRKKKKWGGRNGWKGEMRMDEEKIFLTRQWIFSII
jgi:hypothetical protein